METGSVEYVSMDLISAVREIFAAEAAKDPANAPQLNRVITLMQGLCPDPERSEARQLPGCSNLSRALDLGEAGPAARVAGALRELEPSLHWAQSTRHNVESRGTYFMDNYAYCSLGLTGSADLDFGVMLLGPGLTYPVTSYEPAGIFLVIGGSPEWKSGEKPWARVAAGSIIHRAANGAEGKRPGKEPMLALYAWFKP